MKTRTYLFFIILLPLLLICCKKKSECENILVEQLDMKTSCLEDEERLTTNCNGNTCEIFKTTETMPAFGECDTLRSASLRWNCTTDQVQKFLDENILYPQCAIENNIEGKVAVQFIVLRSGCLGFIRVIEDIGYGCGLEMQRVVSTMPDWKAGMRFNGETADVQINLSYEFKL